MDADGAWRSLLTCFLLMMGDLTGLMAEIDALLEGETGLWATSDHNNVTMANWPTCDIHNQPLR